MKDQYLPEVFLEKTGAGSTEGAVREGLAACSIVLEERLRQIPTQMGKILYFFDRDGTGGYKENVRFREMLDLEDVLREFAGEKCRDFEIMQVCRLLKAIHQADWGAYSQMGSFQKHR